MRVSVNLPIARPPWTELGRRIESACRKALHDFSLIEGGPVGIALSGGKDSLALLFMLHAMRGRGLPDFEMTAFHVQGEFSCGPAIAQGYLQEICAELGVPLVLLEAEQKREKLECYSCSRTRRGLIFKAAKERGIETIAFGHHREDFNQTLLLNLFHIAEFSGLLPKMPMADYGVTIVRPFIYVSEKEIFEFAKLHGFARITCQCPVGQDSKRKKAEQWISRMEEDFPHIRNNLFKAGLNYGSKKALRL